MSLPEVEYGRKPGAGRRLAETASSSDCLTVAPAIARIGSDSNKPSNTAKLGALRRSPDCRSGRSRKISPGAPRQKVPNTVRRRLRPSSKADRSPRQCCSRCRRPRRRDEVAQHDRLLDAARIGGVEIIAGARPAELGDHDPLARMRPAQLVVEFDSVVDVAWDAASRSNRAARERRRSRLPRPVPDDRARRNQISPVVTGTGLDCLPV